MLLNFPLTSLEIFDILLDKLELYVVRGLQQPKSQKEGRGHYSIIITMNM